GRRRIDRRWVPIGAVVLIAIASVFSIALSLLHAPQKVAKKQVAPKDDEEEDLGGALRLDPISVSISPGEPNTLQAISGQLESRGIKVIVRDTVTMLEDPSGAQARFPRGAAVEPVEGGARGWLLSGSQIGPAVVWIVP